MNHHHLLQTILHQRLGRLPHKTPKEMPHSAGPVHVQAHDRETSSLFRHNIFLSDDAGPDRKKLEQTIDQMVASSLVHGRETSAVLRLLFGLVPTLIGR
jgi:hypothetical protein